MTEKKRRFTRKEFIKTSSMGVIATGVIAGTPVKLLSDSKELVESTLGQTGIKMTKLGVGAPRIQEASVLRYALDGGITFIDTGRRYANGKNEEMVGEVIKGRRKEFVIQSKINMPEIIDKKLNSESISAKIREIFNKSIEESLKALYTDYIDVMLFHDGSKNKLLYHETVLESFAKAKQEGKILATGFSVHTSQEDHILRHNRDPFYDVIMISFNAHGGYKRNSREYNWDQELMIRELTRAADSGTGIIAMKTCLGGPYACEGDTEASFPGAVKWVLEQPYVHAAAVAMANFQQLDEHLAVHKV
ncbi:aldo/keto reductase [Bacteroidota bacterium]